MNKHEAIELLSYHSARHQDVQNPKWINGFLGSLRPYQGELNLDNLNQVMDCLKILSIDIRKNYRINKDVVSNLMAIIHLGRAWGVYKSGMLRRNNLIKPEDSKKLEEWIEMISYTFTCLLDGCDNEVAFEEYSTYMNKNYKIKTT